jgi:hypothetical protein
MTRVLTRSVLSKHTAILEYDGVVNVGADVGQQSVSGQSVTNSLCGKHRDASYEMLS